MVSIQNYQWGFDIILYSISMYTILFLYTERYELTRLFSSRSGKPDFYLGILLLICICGFYIYYTSKLRSYQNGDLTNDEKHTVIDLQDKLGKLKFAIISGFSAIIIGSLALINKIIPGFFITLVMIYYADRNI